MVTVVGVSETLGGVEEPPPLPPLAFITQLPESAMSDGWLALVVGRDEVGRDDIDANIVLKSEDVEELNGGDVVIMVGDDDEGDEEEEEEEDDEDEDEDVEDLGDKDGILYMEEFDGGPPAAVGVDTEEFGSFPQPVLFIIVVGVEDDLL